MKFENAVTMGSMQSFDCFFQTPGLSRLAAVHDRKLEVLVLSDRFHQHRTFYKNWRAAELRTLPPFAAWQSGCNLPAIARGAEFFIKESFR